MIDELKKIDNFITSCNRRLLLEQINDEKKIYFVLINKIYTVNNRKKIMNLLLIKEMSERISFTPYQYINDRFREIIADSDMIFEHKFYLKEFEREFSFSMKKQKEIREGNRDYVVQFIEGKKGSLENGCKLYISVNSSSGESQPVFENLFGDSYRYDNLDEELGLIKQKNELLLTFVNHLDSYYSLTLQKVKEHFESLIKIELEINEKDSIDSCEIDKGNILDKMDYRKKLDYFNLSRMSFFVNYPNISDMEYKEIFNCLYNNHRTNHCIETSRGRFQFIALPIYIFERNGYRRIYTTEDNLFRIVSNGQNEVAVLADNTLKLYVVGSNQQTDSIVFARNSIEAQCKLHKLSHDYTCYTKREATSNDLQNINIIELNSGIIKNSR